MRPTILAIAVGLWASSTLHAQSTADDPFGAYAAGDYRKALTGAEAALADNPESATWWALVAEARAKLSMHQGAAGAFEQAALLEADVGRKSYLLRAQAYQLVLSGRLAEAALVVDQALADPALATGTSLDWAMVAIAAGRDEQAQEILTSEELRGEMTRQAALDAAYSAKRVGLDKRAVEFFELGLVRDAEEGEQLQPAAREAIRRETRELSREWSFLSQSTFSTAGRPIGPGLQQLEDERLAQFGAEISRRIGGWRNGEPLSVFARVFHTEPLSDPYQSGNASQGWLGVRYKPLARVNFNIEASKLVGLDAQGLDDWSLRGMISGGMGLEPKRDARDWIYAHYYSDLTYLVESDSIYGLHEGRAGYSRLLDERTTVLTPYVVVRLDIDSGRATREALGAGAGMSIRRWFDETDTVAHRGFIDFDVQAREHIVGDRRAAGVMATVTLGR